MNLMVGRASGESMAFSVIEQRLRSRMSTANKGGAISSVYYSSQLANQTIRVLSMSLNNIKWFSTYLNSALHSLK